MKFIHNMLNKVRPLFDKGGKLEKLEPIFEAQETFLFVLPKRTTGGAHIRDAMDTKRYMSIVIVALLPCLVFGIYNVGYQSYRAAGEAATILQCFLLGARYVVPIIIVSYAAGGFWEVLFAAVRKHEINEGFLVTGMLLPLIVPPTVPLWQVAVGISFGVVIGKEVFGGTGMNIFNPALTARAFMFFAYATKMSGDQVWVVIRNQAIDGFSGATPLAVATQNAVQAQEALTSQTPAVANAIANYDAGQLVYTWQNLFLGRIPGSIGETSTLLCLVGAVILIVTGVGSWRIMVSVVVGAVGTAFLMNALAPSSASLLAIPAQLHLVMGGFAFGTVFMATDPVSGAHTNIGKYFYGLGIGILVIIVRTVNLAYPEGMMLSILFMNAFSPLIDYVVLQVHIKRRLARG